MQEKGASGLLTFCARSLSLYGIIGRHRAGVKSGGAGTAPIILLTSVNIESYGFTFALPNKKPVCIEFGLYSVHPSGTNFDSCISMASPRGI
jgi:hypothetical protein